MNRELVIKLLKIKREQARRYKNNRLSRYNTGDKVHKKQLLFHECPKKNRWVFGGNRSGKTECGAVETIYFARGNHPYRHLTHATSGWVVSLTTQVQRDVAQAKILQYLNPEWIVDITMSQGRKDSPERGVIDQLVIKNVFGTTSTIGFKSCDQGREKFQGTSLDYVWFDEEPPEDIYTECKMRLLDKNGDMFGTMTPLKGLTFVYDQIYLNKTSDPEIWTTQMSWDDNPFISERAKREMCANLSPDVLRSRKYGEFMSEGGQVYPEFDPEINVIEPFNIPYDWQDKLSIDPGLKNPLSCHWYAVDYDGNVYVVAEHYDREKDISYHADCIHKICERLNWHTLPNGNIEALIDSAANQTTLASTRSVADLFYDYGISVNTNVNKDLFSGINRVKSYLCDANGNRKLFIFSTCTNMIREMKGYLWGNADHPIKRDDHSMDELRYYIMSRPDNHPAKPVENERQKHLNRLIRRKKYGI